MADKIVQLKDGNDKLYPLCKGLAANSVSTSAIQDGAVTADKAAFTGYSTTPKYLGTDWAGYPLYGKVIDFGALPNASQKEVDTGLASNEVLMTLRGYAYANQGTVLPLPYVAGDASYNVAMNYNGNTNKIQITTYQNRSGFTGIIYIEYVVTTSTRNLPENPENPEENDQR